MEFRLTINMDNAAFDTMPGVELSRILAKLQVQVYREADRKVSGGKVMDANGNSVGSWEIVP